MGRPKMTLAYGESTILETVARAVEESDAQSVTVVLGHNWEHVYAAVQHLDAQIVVNPRPERGMLSSAQWGLAHVREDAEAILFALGDQPQILPSTINILIKAAAESECGIFLPTYQGKRGHPLLVKSRHKPSILGLSDSGGLNQLLDQNPQDISEVPVESATVLKDIDTPEEYDEATKS